ncbi:hypothetical protein E4U43_000377 [Claviceps pusilla]|uniref:Hydroxyproline-rich glycoprotein n=1 Tax=Claviceps pusilla TaxID=123648 RepID=A0A9P7NH81_9HYPO|nr:hypothetical protein E4U43_000377 [Claviceps pusilla]
MAARAGEENVATLFGDIHYFFGSAAMNPRHHRFDKGSYVYLFENASQRRCRVEVANHPGTAEQDAFDGHALQFVNGVRRVLPPTQMEISDEPALQPGMHSVIQSLEGMAFSDSQCRKDSSSLDATSRNLPASAASVTSASRRTSSHPPPPPPPPPPLPPPSQTARFVPMAYNPAAPAAPEPIKYREKTPPPDEDPLNPLAVAVAHDYERQPFSPAFPHQSQVLLGVTSPRLPPNAINNPAIPSYFSAPPRQQLSQRADTIPINASLASPGLNDSLGSGATPGSTILSLPTFSLPPAQPTSFSHSPAQFSQQVPPNRALPTPTGQTQSYSDNSSSRGQHSSPDYTIHQQFYKPTESELSGNKPPQYQGRTEPRGVMGESTSRLERGVTGMLKKLEKKLG